MQSEPPATSGVRRGKDEAILALLGKLALHYWRPDFTPRQARQLYADYLDDLRDYPLADIRDSIAAYRRSGAKFFPTSGQLLAPLTTRPAWDVGTNDAYAREMRKAGRGELEAMAKRIENWQAIPEAVR